MFIRAPAGSSFKLEIVSLSYKYGVLLPKLPQCPPMPVSTGAQTKKPCHRCSLRLDDIRCSQSRSTVGSRERNKRTSCSTRVPRPLIDLTRDHGLKLSPSDPSCWICFLFFSCASPLSPSRGGRASQLPLSTCCWLLLAWPRGKCIQ